MQRFRKSIPWKGSLAIDDNVIYSLTTIRSVGGVWRQCSVELGDGAWMHLNVHLEAAFESIWRRFSSALEDCTRVHLETVFECTWRCTLSHR